MENHRIELRRIREFGEVFNATFEFIKQEFKPLGKSLLVFVLPFVMILGIVIVLFSSFSFGMLTKPENIGTANYFMTIFQLYAILIIAGILLQTMIMSTVYSYLNLYLKKSETGISEMFTEIRGNFFPVLGASILSGVVIIIGCLFCFFPGIYLGVSLSMINIALIIEKKGIGNAFSRSFQLSHKQWGWTFLILFVSIILYYVISLILNIPGMVIGFTSVWQNFRNPVNPYEKYGMAYIIYTAAISTVTYLLLIIPALLIAFQYFNIVETIEKPSLVEEIGNIGKGE
jgi:hypothetical protein